MEEQPKHIQYIIHNPGSGYHMYAVCIPYTNSYCTNNFETLSTLHVTAVCCCSITIVACYFIFYNISPFMLKPLVVVCCSHQWALFSFFFFLRPLHGIACGLMFVFFLKICLFPSIQQVLLNTEYWMHSMESICNISSGDYRTVYTLLLFHGKQ